MSLGGGTTISTSEPRLGALRVQQSSYGLAIPIVQGRNRISGNLLWYDDFRAIAHTTTSSGGGKGGEVSQSNTTYTYEAAIVLGLCEGPLVRVRSVWQGKRRFAGSSTRKVEEEAQAVPASSPYTVTVANAETFSANIKVQKAAGVAYDEAGTAYTTYQTLAAGADYTVAAGVYTFAPAHAGAQVTISYRHTVTALDQLGLGLAIGTPGQSVWSYLTSKHPAAAIGYSQTAYVYASTYRLTGNAEMHNHSFEVEAGTPIGLIPSAAKTVATVDVSANTLSFAAAPGFRANQMVRIATTGTLPAPFLADTDYHVIIADTAAIQLAILPGGAAINITNAGSGTHTVTPYVPDVLPGAYLTQILASAQYGAGFPLAKLGDMSAYDAYCGALGLVVSPVLAEQQEAARYLDELARLTNSEVVWSEAKLKMIPYGDENLTGNGYTFTANVTPAYDLGDDDFIVDGDGSPLKGYRKRPADAFNQVRLEIANRNNQYNPEPIERKDQLHIETYGLRPKDPIKAHIYCDPFAAGQACQLILQRELYVPNTWEFPLGWKYARLEPMDIVTLTDASQQLDRWPVRITEIEEDEDGGLMCKAEDCLNGVAGAALYANQDAAGYLPDYGVAVADVVPTFVDAPGRIAASPFELWMAFASDDPNWGGCEIWASDDGDTYKRVGVHYGRSRVGSLTATLPLAADPDTTSTLAVDLAASLGELESVTQTQLDALFTLALVDAELIAYRDVTLTGAYAYDLTTLRRGLYGSAVAAHAPGAAFVRLDGALYKMPVDASQVGRHSWFKFLSFNVYGNATQSLDQVPSYGHTLGGSTSYPSDVTGASVQQNGPSVLLEWDRIDPKQEPDIKGFEWRMNPLGNTRWDDATPITQETRGTENTTVKIPPGPWTFLACAMNSSGRYSRNPARVDRTITSDYVMVLERKEHEFWELGTLTDLVLHGPTRSLLPRSQVTAQAAGWATFNEAVPQKVATARYESPELDLGADGDIRAYGLITSALLPGTTGIADPEDLIDFRAAAGAYDGFSPWSIGYVTARYLKHRIDFDTAEGLYAVSSFTIANDAEKRREQGYGVAIDANGVTVPFAKPFFQQPVVTTQFVSASAGNSYITAQSTADFTAKSTVAGNLNWTAEGV